MGSYNLYSVNKIGYPIAVAMLSKVLTVFTCWNDGVVGSNLTRGKEVCFILFVFPCVQIEALLLAVTRPWRPAGFV
jgi:hypothetical protein